MDTSPTSFEERVESSRGSLARKPLKIKQSLSCSLCYTNGRGNAPASPYFRVNPVLNATQITPGEIQPHLRLDPYDGWFAAQNTILVVEDEAFVREAACDILESEGYRVLRARNAAEAQAAFRRQQGSVQLLLSDVVLPGQNGPALAKDLRTSRPTLKAIFISG